MVVQDIIHEYILFWGLIMEYKTIAEELKKNGFVENKYGSPEKTIGQMKVAFVDHPFYHVILYSRKSEDGRTIYTPGEIKLPKKCDINDVKYVIDSLERSK